MAQPRDLVRFSQSVKYGGEMLLQAFKAYQERRISEQDIDKVVNVYADALSRQIIELQKTQEQVLNMVVKHQTQLEQADKILENIDPEVIFNFLKNVIAVKAFKVIMEQFIEFLKTTKGRILLGVFILSAVRAMDTLVLGGLGTKGAYVSGKFIIKKLKNTKSLLKKIIYFVVFLLNKFKKPAPIRFNSRPVFNVTKNKSPVKNTVTMLKRSRKQNKPTRSALS
jgi:hypothetical protein